MHQRLLHCLNAQFLLGEAPAITTISFHSLEVWRLFSFSLWRESVESNPSEVPETAGLTYEISGFSAQVGYSADHLA